MPRRLLVALAVMSTAWFFVAAALLGVLLFPIARLFAWTTERHRRWCTLFLHKAYPTFLFWLRLAGLIRAQRTELPPEVPRDGAYLLIANHPTLLDVIYLLSWYRRLTCVVKAAWYRSFVFGPMLRSTHYIPGPGLSGDETRGETPALDRMVAHLEAGHPLLVFPEGTRSKADRLHRFRRGPFEAAVRAKVPIVPLYMHVPEPGLTRERTFPDRPMRYESEFLPVTDTAEHGASSEELRRRYQRLYEERFAELEAERVSA